MSEALLEHSPLSCDVRARVQAARGAVERPVEITLPEGAGVHARGYRLVLPSGANLRRNLLEWTGEAVP